ncbi:type III secretion system cytoplasmic ring protein SctQ [Acidovorax sp.]|uniref:type III secretion system cytoplasmic ring protein SctQ n=1 Tax=Acidovorax sp. TaxID=1872122 RepID=UPI003CFD2D37
MSAQPAPATPLQPQRLSRNEAQARTTIAQRAADLPLRLGSTAWQARLVPTTRAAAVPAPSTTLRFEWAGAQFTLRLPALAIEQTLSASLGSAALPAVPDEVAQALLEASLADLLASLQALGRGSPQLLDWTAGDALATALPPHAFDLLLHTDAGPEAIAASLYADGLGLLLLAGLVARRAPVPGPVQDQAPLALRAEFGCCRLTLDEVSGLAPGDVVLVESCFLGAQGGLWLNAAGQAGLHVSYSQADGSAAAAPSFTVLHPWTDTMPAVSSADEAPANGAAAAALDALPVRLSFDLGDVALTVAQLRALQPGQTLDLGHPLAGAVRIRANGALVGEGDLVEIDGQLGVSIRNLFGNGTAR